MIILLTLQTILFIALAIATLYILFFAIAGLFYKKPVLKKPSRNRQIVVLIPGYREDSVIVEVAKAALVQDYPKEYFDIVVIADSFQPETIEKLGTLPIKVLEVQFDKSTKSKALNKALALLEFSYEICVVLDADNIMSPTFLSQINASFDDGFRVVQGHRTSKNQNNNWAILDSISEEINNHIFRKGHRAIGLSSAIIGSGMAFDYLFFKQMMSSVFAIGGFDKEIELKMLKQGIKIEYLEQAYVYDEKVQEAEVFGNQRRRWLSAQFHYFRVGFLDSVKDLFLKGNVDYFDKAFQFIQPPRALLLGGTGLLAMVFPALDYVLNNQLTFSLKWIVLFALVCLSLIISVPKQFWNFKTLGALAGLPKGIYVMLLSLLKIKGANKTFIHTKHTTTYPENKV
jgi:cellulose synthase/poly-beta-1,6-N-acetylglucosamine synthase-like glycosyltransferase